MEFKYDFQQMRQFVEDMAFIIQSGGAADVLQKTGDDNISKKIINAIKLIFITMGILILIYIIYKIVTGGYSRFVFNLLTFSVSHKENIEAILSQNDLLYTHFDILANYVKKYDCNNPYNVLKDLYKIDVKTGVGLPAQKGQELIEKYYSSLTYEKYNIKYRYREKYQNAFREYFLFYANLSNSNGDTRTYYYAPKGDDNFVKITVNNDTFYQTLITYLTKQGAIPVKNANKSGNVSQTEVIYNMHLYETILKKSKKPTLLEQRLQFREAINSVAQNVAVIVQKINDLPYHHYFLLPNNDGNIANVKNDFGAFDKQIKNWSIYTKQKATDLNEYSWYIIEVFYLVSNVRSNKPAWKEVIKRFKTASGYQKNLLITYINLPREKKDKARKRLFSTGNAEIFDIVQKFPLASKIYYSNIQESKKERLYIGVMMLYTKMMSPSCDSVKFEPKYISSLMKNLDKYSTPYKQLVNSLIVTDMYLNNHRNQIIAMLRMRYLNTEHFYKELWTPHFDDFFHNRIKSYWKRIANMKHFKGDLHDQFLTGWDKVGSKLEQMTKSIWGSFAQKDTTVQPAPPDEAPPVTAANYDESLQDSQNSQGDGGQNELSQQLSESKNKQSTLDAKQAELETSVEQASQQEQQQKEQQKAEEQKRKEQEAAEEKINENCTPK